jgi:hypothetical protein
MDYYRATISLLFFDDLYTLYHHYFPRNVQMFPSKSDLINAFFTVASSSILQTVTNVAHFQAMGTSVGTTTWSEQKCRHMEGMTNIPHHMQDAKFVIVAHSPADPSHHTSNDPRYLVILQMSVNDMVTLLHHYLPNISIFPEDKIELLDYLFQNVPPEVIQTIYDVTISWTAVTTGEDVTDQPQCGL